MQMINGREWKLCEVLLALPLLESLFEMDMGLALFACLCCGRQASSKDVSWLAGSRTHKRLVLFARTIIEGRGRGSESHQTSFALLLLRVSRCLVF